MSPLSSLWSCGIRLESEAFIYAPGMVVACPYQRYSAMVSSRITPTLDLPPKTAVEGEILGMGGKIRGTELKEIP